MFKRKLLEKRHFSCTLFYLPTQFLFNNCFENMCLLKNFIVLLAISNIGMANPVGEWSSEDMPVVYGTIDDFIEQSRNRMLYGNNCGPNGCPDPPSTSFATPPSPPSTTAKTKRANLNNYFRLHVCLSFHGSVRLSHYTILSRITKCH